MYLARFSYDVMPVDRQRAIEFIQRELEAARKNGLNARLLIPLTRGPGGPALQFEVELTSLDQLDQFHLIVGLAPGARERVGKVPFHTTMLTWDIDTTGGPEAVYRQLTPRVRELMERLRGEQAS